MAGAEARAQSGSLDALLEKKDFPPPPSQLWEFAKKYVGAEWTDPSKLTAINVYQGRAPEDATTTIENPRSLISFVVRPSGERIFIGYTPNSNELQIIADSVNPARREFALISGHGTKDQHLHRDQKDKCLSCHHDEGLIFSKKPWSETESNAGIATKAGAALDKMNPVARGIYKRNAEFTGPLSEIILGPFGHAALMFESRVGDAHYFLRQAQSCAKLCVENRSCRAGLLLDFIAKGLVPARRQLAMKARDQITSSLSALYASPQSTSSLARISKNENTGYREAIVVREPSGYIFASRSSHPGSLEAFKESSEDGISPRLPRTGPDNFETVIDLKEGSLPAGLTGCLSSDEKWLKPLRSMKDEQIQEYVNKVVNAAGAHWPPTESEYLKALDSKADDCTPVGGVIPPVAANESLLVEITKKLGGNETSAQREARLQDVVTRSYLECHRKIDVDLPGKITEFRVFRGELSGQSPLERLKLKTMPPSDHPISDETRNVLIQYLESK